MASLIWDTSFISSKRDFKFRVKMSDGSNMADSDEGVDFINIVNTQDFSKIGLGSQGKFVYSLGLGYQNSPYNSMWTQVEEVYDNFFASLGNDLALANSFGVELIPFSHTFGQGQVFVTSMYWEQVNYSCIIQLDIQPQGTAWGDFIRVDRNGFARSADIQIGNASWAEEQYVDNIHLIETYNVDIQDIDDYNILVGFILQITGESGIMDIFPVERSTVDSAISVERINYANDTATAVAKGFLNVATGKAPGTGNSSHGYFGGSSPGTISTIKRIDYSNDTAVASIRGSLSAARQGAAATSARANALPIIGSTVSEFTNIVTRQYYPSSQRVYWVGGGNATNIAQRFDIPNDTVNAVPRWSTTTATTNNRSGVSSLYYGYVKLGNGTKVERLDYANDTPTSVH